MSQQNFTWSGPAQGVTLKDAKGAVVWEGHLMPGRPATGLPAAHPRVVGWVASGMLTGEPAEPSSAEPATRRRSSTKEV